MLKKIGIVCLSVSLCSCSLMFTNYSEPDFPMVTSYKDVASFTGKSLDADYYSMFNDEYLNEAVNRALENNYNLSVSYLNLQKALLYVDISATDRHPTANASLGAQTKRALDYHDSTHKSSSSSLSVSYQLDLFGKIEAQNESAKEQYRASAYDYLAMRLTVIETASKAYWQYAYAKEAVELGLEDLKDSEVRLKLVDSKFAAGAADSLDLDNARINHLKVKTTLEERRSELEKARTALDTVMGTTADKDFRVARLDSAKVPSFSLDVPSSLLANRPDLMKDEALLKEAYADYNIKKMAFFPDLTFTAGSSAGDTQTFGRFLSNPIGTLGAAVTMPFLNFNKLNLERKSAYKDIEIAEANFVSDYIKAVQEVYDLVTDVNMYRTNLKTLRHAYELSVRNYNRYRMRYEAGLVELTDFLSSADTMRNAKISYLMAKRNNLEATVSLMTAIGGGSLGKTDIDNIGR
ncbi:MAG: TolC family protein [Succinivibrio sp.]